MLKGDKIADPLGKDYGVAVLELAGNCVAPAGVPVRAEHSFGVCFLSVLHHPYTEATVFLCSVDGVSHREVGGICGRLLKCEGGEA